jgi:uncharacterized SAM-binding protein YcdF (DUF218 family)
LPETHEVVKGRRGRSRRRRYAVAIATLLLASLTVAAGSALVVRVPLEKPDAIISLASHEYERLPLAARMAAENPGAVVLLTQPSQVTRFNCEDCAHRVDRLRALGVEQSRVRVVLIHGPGTHGEALVAREFASQAGIRRLLIVTSPYHTRRALAVFRRVFAGSGVTLGIEPAIESSAARPSRWLLGSYDRGYVVYEWAGIVYYAWKYGVRPQDLTNSEGS